MITAANLKDRTRQDLAQMARKLDISGWHSMRKDELVRALLRKSRAQATRARSSANPPATNGHAKPKAKASTNGTATAKRSRVVTKSEANGRQTKKKTLRRKSPRVLERIQRVHAEGERLKDLSSSNANGQAKRNGSGSRPAVRRDRIALLVRDPYWLQASWEVSRQSVERVRAAMSQQWHTARPILRLIEVETGPTTSSAERVEREIEVHGGVSNWYIDLQGQPKSYRVDIGYKACSGRFISLARSNAVNVPAPGSSDVLDQNWSDVAKDYERIYSASGGYGDQASNTDLRDLFEERLRRPMGSPMVTKYGVGGDAASLRKTHFAFTVDAELIIYGQTRPDAHVTLAGQPVKLRPDGTFTVRRSMPDRREVLPVVAASGDGLEQRTVILAIERNTKVMEPVTREPTDQS